MRGGRESHRADVITLELAVEEVANELWKKVLRGRLLKTIS